MSTMLSIPIDELPQVEPVGLASMAEIRRHYATPSDASVEDFLQVHRTLAKLLLEAVPQLHRYFADTDFALRVGSDEFGWQTLYVDALWPGPADDAMRAIDSFEDAWWIAKSHEAAGSLTFTYRLV